MSSSSCPVLLLTDGNDPEILEKTEKLSSCGLIRKDFNEQEIMTIVRNALNHHNAELNKQDKLSDLKLHDRKLRSILDSLPELVCRFKSDTTLTYVNKAYCHEFKMRESELIGKKFLELVPESDHQSIFNAISKVNKKNPKNTFCHKVKKKDGSICWQEWTDYFLTDYETGEHEYQSIGRDVTYLKKSETSLKESEHRNQAILSVLPDLLFTINKKGVLIDYHTNDERRLIIPPKSFMYKKITEVFPDKYGELWYENLCSVFETGKVQSFVLNLEHNNKQLYFEIRGVPYSDDKAFYFVRDITEYIKRRNDKEELEKLQLQLAQVQKMESVGRLAGGIAQDFGNMMTIILGHTELALEQTESNQHLHSQLQEIKKAS